MLNSPRLTRCYQAETILLILFLISWSVLCLLPVQVFHFFRCLIVCLCPPPVARPGHLCHTGYRTVWGSGLAFQRAVETLDHLTGNRRRQMMSLRDVGVYKVRRKSYVSQDCFCFVFFLSYKCVCWRKWCHGLWAHLDFPSSSSSVLPAGVRSVFCFLCVLTESQEVD